MSTLNKQADCKAIVTSQDLRRHSKKTHSHIKMIIRDMRSTGSIGSFSTREYQHWQNKKTYTEYLLSERDAGVVIAVLQPKPRKPFFKKRKIRGGVRKAVFARDESICVGCGSSDDLCLDHIIPESRGGTSELDNLQILCRSCNSSKGIKTMEEWRAELCLR
ncbi:5-methylcytosine-specific restriction enzyme A [Shewanella phage vB_SbaS_Y11]|nr:5-methylcytosine-specific restriction enzyme A [Shewanella phage vB_SbaS_Y11]